MKVNVAGAGAGKTSQMANQILDYSIPEGKIVFCIAFSNAAAENIERKVALQLGYIPNNIRISTIHSFLYQELISPYYFFLYGKHFSQLSSVDLPTDIKYRRVKLSELEDANILHLTKIPEKAKWVVYQKSGDVKAVKEARQKLLRYFSDYCAAIFVDEAQDINEEIKIILEALDRAGNTIILYGDPKQDVKGLGCFRQIIDDNMAAVNYIPYCFRCPQKHLDLSNMLAPELEKQIADGKNLPGSIEIVFESDIQDISSFISEGNYGLKYISMKRDRFATHEKNKIGDQFETLRYEVYRAMIDKWGGHKSDLEICRGAFYITEQMLKIYNGDNASEIISSCVNSGVFNKLIGKRYAQMARAFCFDNNEISDVTVVRSIEIIKGLENKRCLFILTPDLAPYLFREKTEDNKTSHLLYVALTRSLDHLTIFITQEVEDKYTREVIVQFLKHWDVLFATA